MQSSKRKQRKYQQSKRSTRKADKREAPEGGRPVCEAGESASRTQRDEACKAAATAAAAAESLCSHALPPRTVAEALSVKINQSVFTSRVNGLICDSEARTAIGSDGQHIGTSEERQALNALRELLGIL
jgi:hypothetical protein